ncbi:hypothetical protein ACA373_01550 [Erwinia sp. STN24]|uniref:hypothetical protein n=1 Tax=Erwinia sp. STN24 TaxID=3233996 RepID=UPI003522B00D
MGTLQLAVILLCGYIFVNNSLNHRYSFKRTTGWDAYFYIAVYGVFFSSMGWALCSTLSIGGIFRWAERELVSVDTLRRLFPVVSGSDVIQLKEIKMLIWSACSVLISAIAAFIRKMYLKKEVRRLNVLARTASYNALETLLIDASVRQFPVIVTLKSRKVYVGVVYCPQLEHGDCEFFSLLPLLSGYRDKNFLNVVFSVNYQSLYIQQGIVNGINLSGLGLDDFQTLLPKREIDNISFFDLPTFQKFASAENDGAPPS